MSQVIPVLFMSNLDCTKCLFWLFQLKFSAYHCCSKSDFLKIHEFDLTPVPPTGPVKFTDQPEDC